MGEVTPGVIDGVGKPGGRLIPLHAFDCVPEGGCVVVAVDPVLSCDLTTETVIRVRNKIRINIVNRELGMC